LRKRRRLHRRPQDSRPQEIRDAQRFEILAQSSDVGAIKIALRLGAPKFYEYIRAFGFGQQTGIELPGESRGMLGKLENWSGISIGAISMGQEVGVTPIQLVTAVSAIANGGFCASPTLVSRSSQRRSGGFFGRTLCNRKPKMVIRPETAATLRRMMEGVILDGTGRFARLDGWTAAGKTGTAQKIDPSTGRYSRTQFIASFTGFAPINNSCGDDSDFSRLAGWFTRGGPTAAPIFKRVAEQVLPYLDVPRDVPVTAKLVQASYKQENSEAPDTSLDDFNPVD